MRGLRDGEVDGGDCGGDGEQDRTRTGKTVGDIDGLELSASEERREPLSTPAAPFE